MNRDDNGPKLEFESKLTMAVEMITQIADVLRQTRIIVITDSWFGNDGLWKPLKNRLGIWVEMISRLRSNNNLFDLPGPQLTGRRGVLGAPLWPWLPYSVIALSPNKLLQLLDALPEDLYVFDSKIKWTRIITHEHDSQELICLAVGST